MSSSCGSCAARAARQRASQWKWTSADGAKSSTYTGKYAEVQAKAKVSRLNKKLGEGQGGTAEAVPTP